MNPIPWNRIRVGGLFAALVLLLAGCAAPPPQAERYRDLYDQALSGGNELSPSRITEFRDAFVGRDIVFRVLWYEYAFIDPDPDFDAPSGLKTVISRSGGMVVKVPAGAYERHQLSVAAGPGDVAKITGIAIQKNYVLLFARKPDDRVVVLTVTMPRRTTIFGMKQSESTSRITITDQNMSVPWLKNVLQTAVEFVASAPALKQVKLPEAEKGLELQPPTDLNRGASRNTPSVALLAAGADPVRIKRGDVVHLTMRFAVASQGDKRHKVDESYLLSFNGKPLPKYPVHRSKIREAGEYNGVYSQKIPMGAVPGTYRFKAEVCIDGACSSRVSDFEIMQ